MSSSSTNPHHLPLAILGTVIITALLFMGLPLLTQVQERQRSTGYENPIMLMAHRPPKPPPPDKDRRKIKDLKPKKAPKKKSMQKRASKPKIDVPKFEFASGVGGMGGMEIMSPGQVGKIMAKIGFDLSEVDKPPRIVRKINPVYPFGAKRQGLTGKVLVRCLVGVDGKASNFKVVKSEPKDVFDEAAVAAVLKWRFKPGILGGEAVPTWVKIPIIFELD
jgi:protein TonB